MHGITFSRRNRRRPAYLRVLADLAGLAPAEHLRPKTPVLPPYQPFQSKADRHRQANAEYRQHGAP